MLKSASSWLFLFSCLLGLRDCTNLTAKRGEDATLKCTGRKDANIIMFKWEKPGLSEGHVIVIKNGIFQKDLQHDSFKGRVDLKDPKWNQTGDFSVILKYVTMNDTGRYECHAGYGGPKPELLSNITLKVEKPDQKDITDVTGKNITLPCQNPNSDLIISTKWKRADLKPEYVVFSWGDKKGQEQHPSFVKRVELQDRQMKDGDVSVILENVTVNDTGTYECHVIWRGNNQSTTADLDTEPICIINLNVPAGQRGGATQDGSFKLIAGLSLAAVVLVAAGVGFWMYRKRQKQQSQHLNSPPAQAQTQMSPSSFQLNSESPAAVPLLSVVPEHRDRNDLRTDGIQQDPTNTPLTLEEEPLHHPQQTAEQ